jgi:hypothetical protein
MAIIGNPWAQDAAAFGQQTGNALSQGLLQLPQQRYAMALQGAQLQRALQQMQMQNEYRQGLLGIRQQLADQGGQYQQDREQDAQTRNMLLGIAQQLKERQIGDKENTPVNLGVNGVAIPAQGLQPSLPDVSPPVNFDGSFGFNQQAGVSQPPMQPSQGLTQPQPQQNNGWEIVPRSPVFKQNTLTPNAAAAQSDHDTLNYMGLLSHSNLMQQNPQLTALLSNRVFNAQSPQTNGPGVGQQTTNSLSVNPPNPQQTTNVMTATHPQTGQRIKSLDGGNTWQPY